MHYKEGMRALAVLVVMCGVAAADDAAAPPPSDVNKPPGWVQIERLDGNSWAGGDVTWLILDFYAPLLWVTLALVVWRLVMQIRAGEPDDEMRVGAVDPSA